MEAALHLVFLAALSKAELHHGIEGLGHTVTMEHFGAAVSAAGHAVESEHDGIEDGGLARAGVAGHKIESMGQFIKRQHRRSGIGAEGGHFQIQRSHACPSCCVR